LRIIVAQLRAASRATHSSRTFQVRYGSFFLSEIFVVSWAKSVFARSGMATRAAGSRLRSLRRA